jgi:hypothetical protein
MDTAFDMPTDRSRKARRMPKAPQAKSRVSNGKEILPNVDGRSIEARRYRDVIESLVRDAGGDPSEAQTALIRRAAYLVVTLENMESAAMAGAPPLDRVIKNAAGGLSATTILGECARVIHSIARRKAGVDNTAAIAALPKEQLNEVVELFAKAADIAHKAASFTTLDVEVYGALVDRLGRTLQRIGITRVPRDVTDLRSRWAADAETLDAEIIADAASVAANVSSGPHTRAFDAEVVSDAPSRKERAGEAVRANARPSR